MLAQIHTVRWADYPQPEANTAASLPDALTGLYRANDAESCSAACDSFLRVIGKPPENTADNTSDSTYFPVLLPSLLFFEPLLQAGPWPQRAALSLLDDLVASFQPEPQYAIIILADGRQQDIAAAFNGAVACLLPMIEDIAASNAANAKLAGDFLDLLS